MLIKRFRWFRVSGSPLSYSFHINESHEGPVFSVSLFFKGLFLFQQSLERHLSLRDVFFTGETNKRRVRWNSYLSAVNILKRNLVQTLELSTGTGYCTETRMTARSGSHENKRQALSFGLGSETVFG